jgi:hypothetical protein
MYKYVGCLILEILLCTSMWAVSYWKYFYVQVCGLSHIGNTFYVQVCGLSHIINTFYVQLCGLSHIGNGFIMSAK